MQRAQSNRDPESIRLFRSSPHKLNQARYILSDLAEQNESQSAGASAVSCRRSSRRRRGRRRRIMISAAMILAMAAATRVVDQLPVLRAMMLPMGTKKAAQPLAVYRSA